jgi:hypothetical protein
VGASQWELYGSSSPTTDSTGGYGIYEVSGTTVSMKIAGTVTYTGTLDDADNPTSMSVPMNSNTFIFTKD